MKKAEQNKSIKNFIIKWKNKGDEKKHTALFWIELLQDVLFVDNATDRIEFEKSVELEFNKNSIDAYIPETRVLIEQKSNTIGLEQKTRQSSGEKLTAFEQARNYNVHLKNEEQAQWIVTSNFKEIWIYNMNKTDREREIIKVGIDELEDKYKQLDFLINKDINNISEEVAVSEEAGDIIGKIYDAFLEEYGDNPTEEELHELNKLCVRLVFCLYAEDAGLFADKQFYNYLSDYRTQNMKLGLEELFKTLNTKEEDRDKFISEKLDAFPYVNGGLFEGDISIPIITEKIRGLLLDNASSEFDWSKINPTIFGSLFESTLNPETRRTGGMHYTSVEYIHKVIDPLFLDKLKQEFKKIVSETKVPKTRIDKLYSFQEKISGLKFLDPACGSGNFLTETYLSLRELENSVLKAIIDSDKKQMTGQIGFGNVLGDANPIKVSIDQFFGIEINDFAVTVAQTALWIAENQMMQKTSEILMNELEFLPLKTYSNIVEGNALKLEWNEVINNKECDYIFGNPPFVGAMYMSSEQKEDIRLLLKDVKNVGEMDFVTGWYKKAAIFIKHTYIQVAFVSTNSICQGQQAVSLWKELYKDGITINFAYKTFEWDSKATNKAHVHVVIIGFSMLSRMQKKIYDTDKIIDAKHINFYLNNGDDYFVEARSNPISNVPKLIFGSMPRDGGNFILSQEEKEELIKNEPLSEQWIKLYLGASEFLHNKKRYCLWLIDAKPNELNQCKRVCERVNKVKQFRENSKAAGTRNYAKTPTLFCQIAQPISGEYIAIPKTSSEKRKYIPMDFLSSDIIASDLLFLIPNASIYHFGVLESNIHMVWMRMVAGRLKSDYRYSKDIVYNNFPWPSPSEEQKRVIEQTAQGIIDARALYPESSLAELYNSKTEMPKELRIAHEKNDKAVRQAYGLVDNISDDEIIKKLMEMYQDLVSKE